MVVETAQIIKRNACMDAMARFQKLGEQMQKRNSDYYKSAKTEIHNDFKTYAQSPSGMLPRACAIDFYARNCGEDEEEKPLRVLEIGVGEGNFARGFLQELQAQDKANKTDLSERITYCLADFSSNLLQKAEKNMAGAGFASTESHIFDAAKAEFPIGMAGVEFNGIYCNELFSDLPSDVFMRDGMKIYAVNYSDKMEADLGAGQPADELALALLESLPQQYYLPINSIAANSAKKIAGLLAKNGCFDIFDYGFYFAEDFSIPPQMWNPAIVREYGSQWTVDLNFIYMTAVLASCGFAAKTQAQKDFAENSLGQKMELSESGDGLSYSTHNGFQPLAPRKRLAAFAEKKAKAEEFDGFYHLRVGK